MTRVLRKSCIKEYLRTLNLLDSRTHTTLSAYAVTAEALDKARPFHEIPGPKPLPLLGNVHRYLPGIGEYSKSQWHESQKLKFERFGSIVREEMPGLKMVHLYDPKDMETISWNEGKYPRRDFFTAMRYLREQNTQIYSSAGVAAANGEKWSHIRKRSQKPMLRPQIMKTYLPQMNIIADDLIRRMRTHRLPNHQVPDFMNELFKWALESVTFILFNERLGCLDEQMDTLGQKYIKAVNDFFLLTAKVELSSFPIWRIFPSLSPSFKKFQKVHDFFFEQAMEYVQKRVKYIDDGKDDSESGNKSLMEMLVENGSANDASVMAVDAMAAGIDTTSLTLAYVLRNLAANPSCQLKLQEEVDRNVPRGHQLTVEALEKMPYLKACIKESMRICPTVQGTSRTLVKDIVLSGYRVPANTLMTLNYNISGLQECNFEDATSYKPERWLQKEAATRNTFAFVPFGFGPRMCIGRRIAELEMFTLLTKIIQNFWVENHSDELKIRFQLVLMITSPLQYEFHERHKN